MEDQLLKLIDDYLFQSQRAVRLLRSELKRDDLLGSVKKKEFPKNGLIGSIEYSFHGVGCSVDFEDCFVDFDFGPSGRVDGFDAWRLYQFAKQFPEKYSQLKSKKVIESGLSKLESLGVIKCPKWHPSTHLFYKVTGKCGEV